MRILSIVGARPQFVKLAAICEALGRWPGGPPEHRIVHTGQHYDVSMSDVFFAELRIPAPDYHLEVGSGGHGAQTGEMLKRLEPVLLRERPDWVVLYGDTNSTLAGAVAATKLHLPTVHVEAGLRSFDRRMPEELNRIAADHLSDLLLCPSETAVRNLAAEGLGARARLTGDVMYDAVLLYCERARQAEAEGRLTLPEIARRPGAFALATVHRAENTDDPARLRALICALDRVAAEICPVLLPLHPRTRQALERAGCAPSRVDLLPPASFFEMLLLESRARFILTDSGGVQKEAYFLRRPCVTLRPETEWVETLAGGCNVLAGCDPARIVDAARRTAEAGPWASPYGSGEAAVEVLRALHSGCGAAAGNTA
jgi:UDP-GlcNAc3NAcA epimerase